MSKDNDLKAPRTVEDWEEMTGEAQDALVAFGWHPAPLPSRSGLVGWLRPHAVWINKHTRERTVIKDFEARTERVPLASGGFGDDHQLVVHHTANVPPGFDRGYGSAAVSFVEHWEPQTVTSPVDSPITDERPRDAGTSGAAT